MLRDLASDFVEEAYSSLTKASPQTQYVADLSSVTEPGTTSACAAAKRTPTLSRGLKRGMAAAEDSPSRQKPSVTL
jgi:hypothetical protein